MADNAQALSRLESTLRLEIETVVSAMSEGLQQQADLRARASEDTLADIQTVWERCKDALAKTESEVSHSSDYLQGLLRSQIQERIDGHESVVRDVNAALAEMANQVLKLRDEVSSQLRLSAAKTKTLAKGVKTAWSDVEAVRSDCSMQLAAAAMSISEMKSKISSIENKDIIEVRQGQQHAELLLKDIERRVGETEEAIKRAHMQIAAENNVLHALVSDASSRQGQRLEDVRAAISGSAIAFAALLSLIVTLSCRTTQHDCAAHHRERTGQGGRSGGAAAPEFQQQHSARQRSAGVESIFNCVLLRNRVTPACSCSVRPSSKFKLNWQFRRRRVAEGDPRTRRRSLQI